VFLRGKRVGECQMESTATLPLPIFVLSKLTQFTTNYHQFSAIVISLFHALSNATKHCHPATATPPPQLPLLPLPLFTPVNLTQILLKSPQFCTITNLLFPALSNNTKHCHPTTATRSITALLPLPPCHCQSLYYPNSLNSQPNHFNFPPLLYYFFPLFPTLPPCHCHSFNNCHFMPLPLPHCQSLHSSISLIFHPIFSNFAPFTCYFFVLFPTTPNTATQPLPLAQ
jgi:hypothetical protein